MKKFICILASALLMASLTACGGNQGEIEVETIDDKKLAVKVPSGTQVGEKLRVRGHGMPMHRGGFGDLYIDVAINIPTKLNDKQKKILNEFAEIKSDKKGWF